MAYILNRRLLLQMLDEPTVRTLEQILQRLGREDAATLVNSINGLSGAVVITTTEIPEGTNLYYTDARVRAALSATGNGLSYNSTTGAFNSNGVSTNTASTLVFRDASGNFSAGTITATLTGNASTASKWAASITNTYSGDASGSVSFDGSANVSTTLTLANVVAAGTNTKLTYNAKGLVTAGAQAAASDLSNGTSGSGAIALVGGPTLTAATTINANSSSAPSAVTGSLLQACQADSTASVIMVDSFAAGTQFVGRRANGTNSVKSAITSGQQMVALNGYGYGSTGYSSGTRAGIALQAAQTWTDANQGSQILFQTTPNGSTTIATVCTMGNDGSLLQTGSIKSSSATAGVGYATGAGGTVTQATSKSTGVTLNTACGAITMNNATLNAGTIVSFVLTNSAIAATDVLVLNHISGGTPGSYTLNARAAAGSATIDVRNNTAGNLSEAIVIQFAVIKGVNA